MTPEEQFKLALWRAVELGWLEPVDHGYCFYCETEGPVFAIITAEAPVQPPRCATCFVDAAMLVVEDNEMMRELMSDFNESS